MKNRLINIICGVLIITSLVIIARSLMAISKKSTREFPQYVDETKPSDPLTEVDFEETLIDVGKLPADTTIYQNYTLKNIGIHPLIVYQISPDCNCTNYEISKGIAMPNDSIFVRLTVDTKNKHIGMFMINTVVSVNTAKRMYLLKLVGEVVK